MQLKPGAPFSNSTRLSRVSRSSSITLTVIPIPKSNQAAGTTPENLIPVPAIFAVAGGSKNNGRSRARLALELKCAADFLDAVAHIVKAVSAVIGRHILEAAAIVLNGDFEQLPGHGDAELDGTGIGMAHDVVEGFFHCQEKIVPDGRRDSAIGR